MTDNIREAHTPSSKSKSATLVGISFLWLAGMGALALGTFPKTASHTSAPGKQVANIKTPTYKPAAKISGENNIRPASAQTQVEGGQSSPNLPAPVENQSVDFIVRFERSIPELEACHNMFRKDKAASRQMFTDWAEGYEELEGMRLKKAAYSGEMILSWNTGSQAPVTKSQVEAKLALINAMPNVRYADPDHTARAEGAR